MVLEITQEDSYFLIPKQNINPELPTENQNIEKCSICPNTQFIAIVISKQKIFPVSNKISHEYLIKVFKLMDGGKIKDGNWLGTDNDLNIFSDFTSDSKYIVSHSMQKMQIIDLISFRTKRINEIDKVYTIDNQNSVYLLKKQNIQIYSLANQEFVRIIQLQNPYLNLLQVSSQLYLGCENKLDVLQLYLGGENKLQVFQIVDVLKKKSKASYNDQMIDQSFTIENNFLIVSFSKFNSKYVCLRNLRNFKLIRCVHPQPKIYNYYNITNEGKNIYVCWLEKLKVQMNYVVNKFNLIKGLQKSKSIKIKYGQELNNNIKLVNDYLLEIDENDQKLRYFICKKN